MRNSFCTNLRILHWKNIILRKHHWFLTICEILIPVIFFVLQAIYIGRDFQEYQLHVNETYNPQRSSKDLYKLFNEHCLILYTPITQFTVDLMTRVTEVLKINDSNVKGFPKVAQLNVYFMSQSKKTNVLMGIIFKNLQDKKIPNHFYYIIRPYVAGVQWSMQLFNRRTYYQADRGSANYIFNNFLPLKMALDTTYLQMVKNISVPFVLQEFPHPEHVYGEDIYFASVYAAYTVFSYIFICPIVLHCIVEEKRNGIKDLMKTMGLQNWTLWLGWFFYAIMVNIISVGISTYCLTAPLWEGAFVLFRYSNRWLIFLFLWMYSIASILLCFVISTFFSTPLLANVCGIFVWTLSYFVPIGIIESVEIYSAPSTLLWSIFPNAGLYLGYDSIRLLERRKLGLQWETVFSYPTGGIDKAIVGYIYIMFALDSFLFLYVTIRIESFDAETHNIRKRIRYALNMIYRKLLSRRITEELPRKSTSTYFGKIEIDEYLPVGIHISNLFKEYDSTVAVNNLSINIYKGQITALLGENGSGKSTILSIIAGTIRPTGGKVLVNSNDIKYHLNIVRRSMGVCSEYNLLFPSLTVREQLEFFGMLKGLSRKSAAKECETLMHRLNMEYHKDFTPNQLSSAMKRKLAVSIAIIGNPKVMLLDQPTAGLDPQCRRAIWDLLITIRSTRVIVFSTQNMEEVDMLADRIGILNRGRLVCYGTPTFLRSHFGSGYRLKIMFVNTNSQQDIHDKIITIVKLSIPKAIVESKVNDKLVFLLPYDSKPLFSELLKMLETYVQKYQIVNIKLCADGTESIFFRVNKIAMNQNSQCDVLSLSTKALLDSKVTDPKIDLKSQIIILIKKRYWVTKRYWFVELTLILVLLTTTFLTLYLTDEYQTEDSNRIIDLNLNKYYYTKVFYSMNNNKSMNYVGEYERIVLETTNYPIRVPSVSAVIMLTAQKNINYYKFHIVVATEFNSSATNGTVINAMYSNSAVHGAPISLNLAVNSVLRAVMGTNYSIECFNNPFPLTTPATFNINVVRCWQLLFPLGIMCYTMKVIIFPVAETRTKLKYLQFMSGVHFTVYWAISFLWDFLFYLGAVFLVVIVLFVYGFFTHHIFCTASGIGTLVNILLAYGCSSILSTYMYSCANVDLESLAKIVFVTLFFGYTLTMPINSISFFHQENLSWRYLIFLIFPQCGLTISLSDFADSIVKKHNQKCCTNVTGFEEYVSPGDKISACVTTMVLSSLLYLLILVAIETKVMFKFHKMFYVSSNSEGIQEVSEAFQSGKPEEDRVCKLFDLERQQPSKILEDYQNNITPDVLLVKNVQKAYGSNNVLKGISFGIKRGDCFGILGVNGTGTTTLMRIIAGVTPFDFGDIRIFNNHKFFYLLQNKKQYTRFIGYCPQRNAIINYLTGRELLYVFAVLRGISKDTSSAVSLWLNILEMENIADVICKYYSKGNKRKLTVGITLIGQPLLMILDEPTRGIDPICCQKLWNIIKIMKNQNNKRSFILISQNMEENESLCNKLSIIDYGFLKCFDETTTLRYNYGRGFTIKIKLKVYFTAFIEEYNTSNTSFPHINSVSRCHLQSSFPVPTENEILDLITDISTLFRGVCTLRDKQNGILHYHVKDKTKTWNQLFRELNLLQQRHPIIYDYDISETTLEELFLSYVRPRKVSTQLVVE